MTKIEETLRKRDIMTPDAFYKLADQAFPLYQMCQAYEDTYGKLNATLALLDYSKDRPWCRMCRDNFVDKHGGVCGQCVQDQIDNGFMG